MTPPSTNLSYILGPPRAGVALLTIEAGVSKFTLSSNPPAMEMSMEAVNTIEDNRAALQAAGSDNAIQVDCDALPGAPNQPGSFSIAWTDVNGNGVIDHDLSGARKHDTFTFTIDRCWIDDPSDQDDLLLDGVIRIAYYEPGVQWGPVFENLSMMRTHDGVLVFAAPVILDGGFSLLIPGY